MSGHTILGFGSAPGLERGTVHVSTKISTKTYSFELRDTVYCPTVPYNLISISSIAENRSKTTFDKDGLWITACNGTRVFHGKKVRRLYLLELDEILQKEIFLTATRPRTWDEWHRTLGHIHPGVIKMLAQKGMVTGLDIDPLSAPSACTVCTQAMQMTVPFPEKLDSIYTDLMQMTSIDVCGPSPMTGLHGEQYSITFRPS